MFIFSKAQINTLNNMFEEQITLLDPILTFEKDQRWNDFLKESKRLWIESLNNNLNQDEIATLIQAYEWAKRVPQQKIQDYTTEYLTANAKLIEEML
jgi:hypothetical protein